MKKIAKILETRVEVFVITGLIVALIYTVIYNSIVYGTYSSPW